MPILDVHEALKSEEVLSKFIELKDVLGSKELKIVTEDETSVITTVKIEEYVTELAMMSINVYSDIAVRPEGGELLIAVAPERDGQPDLDNLCVFSVDDSTWVKIKSSVFFTILNKEPVETWYNAVHAADFSANLEKHELRNKKKLELPSEEPEDLKKKAPGVKKKKDQ